MNKDERILKDLNKHLQTKLARCMADHVDLCTAADLEMRDVLTDMMLMLTHLTASFAASQFNITTEDFVKAMALQFLSSRKREQQEREQEE